MTALQQHLFDTYRAQQLGEPAPPAPGTHDVAVLREIRDRRRFERTLEGRPARLGTALALAVRSALRRLGVRRSR